MISVGLKMKKQENSPTGHFPVVYIIIIPCARHTRFAHKHAAACIFSQNIHDSAITAAFSSAAFSPTPALPCPSVCSGNGKLRHAAAYFV